MKITEITENDIPEISEMATEEFSYAKLSADKILSRKKNGIFIFKAVEENKIAGFVDFQLNGQKAFINGVTVKKQFRGKKIGKTLLKFAINFSAWSGAQKIELIVRKDNSPAKKIYESLGFRITGPHYKKIDGKEIEKMELEIEENALS